MPTTHICPRQTFARGCSRPRRPIRPRPLDRPTVPQAAKRRPTQGASAGAQAGRDWKICGGWLCTHPLFQNTMCKSHKLHCFSKPLLEKALTARRRRVIVTGARARPKAFFLPSGFFAPCFPLHSSCSLSTDVRQAGGRVSTKVNPRFFAARPDAGFPAA